MELSIVAKPSSRSIPIQDAAKTLTHIPTAAPLAAAPFRNRASTQQSSSLLSTIPFHTLKTARASMFSIHIHLPCEPSFYRKPSPTHSAYLLQEHISSHKTASSVKASTAHLRFLRQNDGPLTKVGSFKGVPDARVAHSPKTHISSLTHSPLLKSFLKLQLQLSAMSVFAVPLPSLASETEQVSDKINVESILISIDNFFNRYPFFVASVSFVWLVVIPLAQEYLKKYKYISAINAFRKLRDDPNSQLLDIRKKQSRAYLESPNLKILNKNVVQVEFSGEEEGFVKDVLKNFQDPSSAVVCVLDNFDGDSLKVAEVLVNNGFKEAYAIKGGVRGKDGWQAIQETLLPPSVHVYPRKEKGARKVNMSSDGINKHYSSNNKVQISSENPQSVDNGQIRARGAASETKFTSKSSSSPYPNYPDLKPPSSPTPSKPQ